MRRSCWGVRFRPAKRTAGRKGCCGKDCWCLYQFFFIFFLIFFLTYPFLLHLGRGRNTLGAMPPRVFLQASAPGWVPIPGLMSGMRLVKLDPFAGGAAEKQDGDIGWRVAEPVKAQGAAVFTGNALFSQRRRAGVDVAALQRKVVLAG